MRTSEAPPSYRAFRGLSAFFWTEVRVQSHESTAMATSMVVQGVLLVFVFILDRSLLPVAFLGAIIFSMFTMGQRLLNEAAYIRIDHKVNELYLASPLTPEAYFLGMAAGVMFVYLTPVVILFVLAEAVVGYALPTVLLLVGTGMLVWLFSASFGYVFSTFFRDNRAIWAYASIVFNGFGVLPPVFYPLSYFPVALQPVALVLPPSAATALLQVSIGATSLPTGAIVLAAGALVAETVAMFLFTIYWARRKVREA
ncbi:MAG: ABC transporter permease [Thermoplasmata archaeon]